MKNLKIALLTVAVVLSNSAFGMGWWQAARERLQNAPSWLKYAVSPEYRERQALEAMYPETVDRIADELKSEGYYGFKDMLPEDITRGIEYLPTYKKSGDRQRFIGYTQQPIEDILKLYSEGSREIYPRTPIKGAYPHWTPIEERYGAPKVRIPGTWVTPSAPPLYLQKKLYKPNDLEWLGRTILGATFRRFSESPLGRLRELRLADPYGHLGAASGY